MDFGVCVASKIDDIGYIEKAEALGYSHARRGDHRHAAAICASTPDTARTPCRRRSGS